MPTVTFPAADLALLAAAAKLRRYTKGRTCQLCVLSGSIAMQVDCHHRSPSPSALQYARRLPAGAPLVAPMQRGHIGHLYEMVNLRGTRREVQRTWRTGIRALRTEPRYVLNGGRAAA